MLTHDIIVVGASAGGVEPLIELVGGLPADLPAAVFVVLHVPPHSPSHLPEILSRRGPLPAAHAVDGEAIVPGRIYVAPPDRHLLVRDGYVELTHGPRENGSRPAVDALFRSAARAYGPRVMGVVLSGALGDGAMGLLIIAARGGVTVVQDPEDALFDSMPRTALRSTRIDYTLPSTQIPDLLARLTRGPAEPVGIGEKGWQTMSEIDDEWPPEIRRDITAQAHGERKDETTIYTCPECGGTLWQINRNGLIQFNCHVGHTYAAEALLGQMSDEVEAALWVCVRMLVEKATLTRQMAQRLRASGQEAQATRLAEQAEANDRQGQLIRDTLLEAMPSPASEALVIERAWEGTGH